MKKIEIIELRYDINQGPVWLCNQKTGKTYTGIKKVDKDEKLREINLKLIQMVQRYHTYDENGIPIDYNYDLEKKEIETLLDLINKLNERLKEINDGSFIIQDYITPKYELIKYYKDDKNAKRILDVNYLLYMHPVNYNLYLEKIKTGIKQVDSDSIIKHLNDKLFKILEKVFPFDYDLQEHFYDKKFETKNKDLIISLYKQLFKRLDELNDGSYIVRNRVSYLLGDF